MTQPERRALRLEYMEEQGGECWYCKADLSGPPAESVANAYINELLFPQYFFKYPVHLHHDHDTDMTIGAVHCECNAFMFQYHGE